MKLKRKPKLKQSNNQQELDKMEIEQLSLYPTDSGFDCVFCKHRVMIVHSAFRPFVKGAYCDCTNWVGNIERVPFSEAEWKAMIIKTLGKINES
jgi:hypothetical protein